MTVYYVRSENGAIKIGYTDNLLARMSSLGTASPMRLEVVAQEEGGKSLERERHRQYKALNTRGEWFRPSDELHRHILWLNPEYKIIPYWDAEEQRETKERLDRATGWFSTNQDAPPKIGYVSLVLSLLVLIVSLSLLSRGIVPNEEEMFIVAVIGSPIFFVSIVGYVLIKIWSIRYYWRNL